MKIVFFVDHLRHDGTQRKIRLLAEGLTARGHRCAIVCLNNSWDAELLKALRQIPVDIRIIGRPSLFTGIGIISTLFWLRHERFDSAAMLLFASDVIGRPLARVAGIRRIVTSTEARNIHYRPWQRWLLRRTARWTDAVLINTHAAYDFVVKEEGANPRSIRYVPTSIRTGDFNQVFDCPTLRADLDIATTDVLMGCVGRLTYQKGFDLLVDTLALIPGRNIHLLIIGSGEEEQNLRAQAVARGIAERVHFAGHRRDIAQLLGILNIYVHPSRWEGMPAAIVEAMAAGLPIIASAIDGNSELIDGDRYGWLVPPDNSSRLAEVIQWVVDHPAEARLRGQAARERAGREFDIDGTVALWESVLKGD